MSKLSTSILYLLIKKIIITKEIEKDDDKDQEKKKRKEYNENKTKKIIRSAHLSTSEMSGGQVIKNRPRHFSLIAFIAG